MTSFATRSIAAALIAWSATLSGVAGQTQPREPHTFLSKHIGFKPAELAEMEQGRVVAKVLETNVKTEVAVFGVVWIDAPMDWFVRWQKDIETLESGDAVQAIKKISDPPQLSDFDNLTFPEDDLEAIPDCKVGKCDVKVDGPTLERIQKEVNWSAPDAHEQASRFIRQTMLWRPLRNTTRTVTPPWAHTETRNGPRSWPKSSTDYCKTLPFSSSTFPSSTVT
jgi:hypothetical protein